MFRIQTNSRLLNTVSCIPSKDYQSARSRPTRKSVPQLQTPATFLQQFGSSAANLSRRYCSNLSFLLLLLHSSNNYYCPISTILSHDLRTRRIQPLRKFVCQLWEKRLTHLVYCTESRIVLKMGQEKLYLPTERLAHCSVTHTYFQSSLRILFTVFFGNENSTLEINVNHFGVLHWQQWQTPASAPHSACRRFIVRKAKIF